MTPIVELKNIHKSFTLSNGTPLKVLSDVQLQIQENEFAVLLGPSGAGKSTCLRILCGLSKADSGDVLVRGKKIDDASHELALVFQSAALFPWLTVFSNIRLALKPLALSEKEERSRVKTAIDLVGLEGFEEAYPRELSGGMKQRAGLARALVMERTFLLLDEPFSSLDVLTADTLRTELLDIWIKKKSATQSVLLVTHNIQEAVFMAQKIFIMGTNPGQIRKQINNDLPYPRDENSPAFRRMVSKVHEMITESLIPDQPESTPVSLNQRAPSPVEALPNVQIGELIGFLEAIGDEGGTVDMFEMGQKTRRDFGSTLYLAKAAEILDLVETPKNYILLSTAGRQFIDSDINTRKRMLNRLIGELQIVQLATNLLRKQEEFRMPIDVFTERVGEWLPNENSPQVVDVLISWGRFAEYFGYNDDTKEVYLDVGQETT